MADNVGYTPGSGATIAADDVALAGVLFQRMKLAMGPDGTWSADAQTPSADALATTTALLTALGLYDGSTLDRLRSLDAFKTAASTPDVGLLGVAPADRRFTQVTVATTGSTTLAADTIGATSALIRVATARTGAFRFEVTPDGTNWITGETFDVVNDVWLTGQTWAPAAGATYRVQIMGMRALRATVTSTLSGTTGLDVTLTSVPTMLDSINTSASPHAVGQTWISKTAQYTTAQTGTALWTPASGKRIVVTSYQIQVGGTTAGTLQLWFGASADTAYTRGTDWAIFDGEFAPSSTLKPGVVQTGVWIADAADRLLRVTDSAAINPLTVTVWGYETV